MRIISTYENALPISQADAEVVISTAAALARRGHDVQVVSPANPNAPTTNSEIRDYYGVQGPLRFFVQPPSAWSAALSKVVAPTSVLERGRQHITQTLALPRTFRPANVDLVYTRHFPLALHALRVGHRVFFDHYRPWGDQVPPFQLMIRAMAGHPGFVGMVAHSEVAARAYRRVGIPEAAIQVRHNGFDPARMEPVLSREAARQKLGLNQDQATVVYTGRVNEKKGLDLVLEMAKSLSDVHFILVGSEGRGPIEVQAEALANVTIIPWQAFSATTPYLYAADVLIIPPSSAPLAQHGSTVLPLKVYLYLASGRTIFAGGSPDIREVLNEDNACLVQTGQPEAAVTELRELLADKERLQRLGKGAARTAASLTWDKRAEKIETFMEERMEARHSPLESDWSAARFASECAGWFGTGVRTRRWIRSA